MKGKVAAILKGVLDEMGHGDLSFVVDYPDEKFGDYATNAAFLLSKKLKRNPREIAGEISERIKHPDIERIEVAGAGFINFRMKASWWHNILREVLNKRERFGESEAGKGKKVHIEFVSANPTGPLHVGHARGAAVGDSLARIMEKCGYTVIREYYVNDAGRQITLLGKSIYARIMELTGESVVFPEDGYKGEYIKELAKKALNEMPHITEMPEDEAVKLLSEWGTKEMLDEIKKDLNMFGVKFDVFFHEKSLYEDGLVNSIINELKEKNFIYEKDNALWFKSSMFGDEKDRVVIRANGDPTYFASDIAYHKIKLEKGCDLYINIWGADHHGYIKRVKAAVKAMGYDPDKLKILLVQMVNFLKDGKPVTFSKREGEIITLRYIIDEVGKDAARFIFLTRKNDAHLDFDLEIAKRQTEENPVFYVQYAHARICSIKKVAESKNIKLEATPDADFDLLTQKEEKEIMRKISQFPEIVETCSARLEPHILTYYLYELASLFHTYYNRYRVIQDNRQLMLARFSLCEAVRIIIKEGLSLVGVNAPEVM